MRNINFVGATGAALVASARNTLSFAPQVTPETIRDVMPFDSRATRRRYDCRTDRRSLHSTVLGVGSLGEALNDFYVNAPVEAAFITCAVKASAADALVQVQEQTSTCQWDATTRNPLNSESSNELPTWLSFLPAEFEVSRNVGFLLYGGFYQGLANYFWFNVFFPHVFGTATDPLTVAMKVLTDEAILAPMLNLPCSYSIKAAMHGSSNPIQDGVQHYMSDIVQKDLLFKFWTLWIPVQTLTFSVVPDHLRIPFIAVISFFWLICLSSLSSDNTHDEEISNVATPSS